MLRHRRYRRPARGLSLVESLVSTGVMATLLGLTAPTFIDQAQQRRVESVAAQFETDFQFARGAATLGAEPVRISVHHDAGGSCYLVHTGAPAACVCGSNGASQCVGEAAALRVVALPRELGIGLQANSPTMLVDAVGGTVTPTGTLRWTASAARLNQVVNIMGRLRACSPDASIHGLPRC